MCVLPRYSTRGIVNKLCRAVLGLQLCRVVLGLQLTSPSRPLQKSPAHQHLLALSLPPAKLPLGQLDLPGPPAEGLGGRGWGEGGGSLMGISPCWI